MSETDNALINKIVSLEAELVKIYTEIYSLLTNIAQKGGLDNRQLSGFNALKPPTEIPPSDAVGVLRSIIGSTDDKLKLEHLYGVRLPDGTLLGDFLRHKLNKIGIGWSDFFPYLSVRGWFVNNAKPE